MKHNLRKHDIRKQEPCAYFLHNKLPPFDIVAVHLLNRNLDRVRVLELDDAAAPRLVILIREELDVCHLTDLGPEQIFKVLPTKVIWNVGYVDASVGCFPAATVVPVPAAIATRGVYTIWPVRPPIAVPLSTPVTVIVLWLITVITCVRSIINMSLSLSLIMTISAFQQHSASFF